MQEQLQKKKREEKGFDLLEAIYAEKGLISTGGSARLIAAKAVADTQAHAERKVGTDKELHRAKFVEGARGKEQKARAEFLEITREKQKKKPGKMPLEMKKPGIDPDTGKRK